MPLTANDCRRNAAAEDDPLLLTGPDITDYGDLGIMLHASGDPSVTLTARPDQVTPCPED